MVNFSSHKKITKKTSTNSAFDRSQGTLGVVGTLGIAEIDLADVWSLTGSHQLLLQ